MTAVQTEGDTAPQRFGILPGTDDVAAVLALSLWQTDGELFAILQEVDRLGWELAPDRLSRLSGNLQHIGLVRAGERTTGR